MRTHTTTHTAAHQPGTPHLLQRAIELQSPQPAHQAALGVLEPQATSQSTSTHFWMTAPKSRFTLRCKVITCIELLQSQPLACAALPTYCYVYGASCPLICLACILLSVQCLWPSCLCCLRTVICAVPLAFWSALLACSTAQISALSVYTAQSSQLSALSVHTVGCAHSRVGVLTAQSSRTHLPMSKHCDLLRHVTKYCDAE